VIGIGVGSIIGGTIIQIGKRKILVIFTIVAILGIGISLILSNTTIFIGRLIYGIASGILT
jgi:hypothetical protein